MVWNPVSHPWGKHDWSVEEERGKKTKLRKTISAMKLDARKGHLIIVFTRGLRGYEGQTKRCNYFSMARHGSGRLRKPAALLTLAEHACIHHKSEADLVPKHHGRENSWRAWLSAGPAWYLTAWKVAVGLEGFIGQTRSAGSIWWRLHTNKINIIHSELALVSFIFPRAHFKTGGNVRLLWQGVIHLLWMNGYVRGAVCLHRSFVFTISHLFFFA